MRKVEEINDSVKSSITNQEVSKTMSKAVHAEPFKVTQTAEAENVHSGKYGTTFCPNCRGSGRYFYVDRGAAPCNFCGGSGLTERDRDRVADENETVDS